eukprot:869817-Pleurochrysis_carterae.AAC.1
MTHRFNAPALAEWCSSVLVQEARYQELGAWWAPSGMQDVDGAEWHDKGSLLSEEKGLGGALTYETVALRAVGRALKEWKGSPGATKSVLP